MEGSLHGQGEEQSWPELREIGRPPGGPLLSIPLASALAPGSGPARQAASGPALALIDHLIRGHRFPCPGGQPLAPDGPFYSLALPGHHGPAAPGTSHLPGSTRQPQNSGVHQLVPDQCVALANCRKFSTRLLEQVHPVSRPQEGSRVFHSAPKCVKGFAF